MEISPYMLSLLLVYSFLFGASSGAFNDANRILRIALGIENNRKSKCARQKVMSFFSILFICIQDILLFAYMGIGVAVLNYYLNRGIFRPYSVIAVAVGFILYYFTLGKIVRFFSERIVRLLRLVVLWILKVVLAPIRFVLVLCLNGIKKLWKKYRFAIAKRRIIRYNKIKRAELKALSNCGFVADKSAERKGKE